MPKKAPTFDEVFRRMQAIPKARKAYQKMVNEMSSLTEKAAALAKEGKKRQAAAALGKAEKLQKQLGLSSRRK